MFRVIGVVAVLAGLFTAGDAIAQVKIKFKTPEAKAAYEAKRAQRKQLEAAATHERFTINPAEAAAMEAAAQREADLAKELYRAQAAAQANQAAQAAQAAAASQAAAMVAAAVAANQQASGPRTYQDAAGNTVTEYPNGMRRVQGPVTTTTEYPNGIREERTNFGDTLIGREVPRQRVDVRFQPYYPRYAPLGW